MSVILMNKEIKRIHVIDDDPLVRKSYLGTVKDMGILGIDVSTPIKSIDSLFDTIDPLSDGVIFDYQLNSKKYSKFNGDVYGEAAYHRHIPFIISSHFQPLSMDGKRRFIPKAVNIELLEPASVIEAFELCIGEYRGKFVTRRLPIRTLVRVEGIESLGNLLELNVVVPNWNPHTGIRIRVEAESLPNLDEIKKSLNAYGEARLTAEVNTGAEDISELFFSSWKTL